MKKHERQLFISILIATAFLLLIRIVFFLKDGSSDLAECFLFILIFILSIGIFVYYLYYLLRTYDIHIRYFDKIILFSYILIMEILFHVHHYQVFSYIYIFSLMFGSFILVTVSLLLPRKISRLFDVFVMFLYFIYVIGQDIYLTLFGGLFSLIDIVNAKEGAAFARGVYTYSVYHVLYILMFATTLAIYINHKRTSHLSLKYGLNKLGKVLFVLFFLVNMNAVYPVKSARLHTSDHYIYYSNYDKERVASTFSLINMLYRDIAHISIPDFGYKKNIDFIETYLTEGSKTHETHSYEGIFDGKNLVFILGESFDDLAVSESLTPNIYKLQNQGITFTNHFTPVFPRTTCDTEIILNTGLIPSITEGPTCYMFNENSYHTSLANLFNDKGYQTRAFHSNEESFYTRDVLYEGLGYNHFSGRESLSLSLTDKRYDHIFAKAVTETYTSDEKPFFSFLLTLSGHSPYTQDNLAVKKHIDDVNDYYGDQLPVSIKNYIASQMEFDLFVGEIVSDLEEKGVLKDTVIMLMNDHYPYTVNQADYEMVTGKVEEHDKQRGSLIIWSEDITPRRISRVSSSFDILPTIATLFNLDINYQNYVGNDIFDTSTQEYVFFKDYVVYDGKTYIDILSPANDYENQVSICTSPFYDFSISVLKTNYFKADD